MKWSLVVCTSIALAVGGCGGSGGDDAGPTASPGDTAVADTDAPGGTNTPAESATPGETTVAAPSVAFEEVELEEGLVAPIPVGWEPHEFLEWKFQAPVGSGFDPYPPSYLVSLQCAGVCEPRTSAEWAAAVEQALFASYRNPEEFEIVRDEVDDNGAVLETYHFGWTDLQIARWVDGRDRIVTCHLSLHEEHAELKAAFEDACLAIDSPALATG